jgi:outer membrane usher protein FimD/PapC
MTPDSDILLSQTQLKELGFSGTPGKARFIEGLISLKSLSPEVSFILNTQESTLNITANPTLLEKQVIDLGYEKPKKVIYPKENSVFLNYAITETVGDKFDFQSLNIPTEMGVRINDYLVYSNFSYTKTDTENNFVRLMTNNKF